LVASGKLEMAKCRKINAFLKLITIWALISYAYLKK
jgi:hypothetical protein